MSGGLDDLRDLYQDVILDHGRHPRHGHRLAAFDASAKGDNPMCGDRVEVFVRRAPDGTIAETGFEARGCAISIASADLMAETVAGKRPEDARALFAAFRDLARTGACPACDAALADPLERLRAACRRARIPLAREMRDARLARADRRAGWRAGGQQ